MNVRAPRLAWLAAVLGLAPLHPCFADGPASGASGAPTRLHVTPAAVPQIDDKPVRLSIGGFRGAPHVAWDSLYVDVSEVVVHGSSASFSITKVTGGSTVIIVSDDGGQRVSIPVDATLPCTHPIPPISLVGEVFGAPADDAGKDARPAYVFFYSLFDFVHAARWPYPIRLHGSDGSLLKTPALLEAASLTGRAVAVPAIPAGTAPRDGVMLYAEFGPLPVATTYDVQLVARCESPIVLGTFTTRPH